jgi:translation initiation factor 6
MTILQYQIFGQNSVGVFLTVNNRFGLIPPTLIKAAEEKVKNVFNEPLYPLSINNSNLLGVYSVSNINGIIIPHIIREDELETLQSYIDRMDGSFEIGILKSLDNAFGNMILCNDKGAIISSFLKDYRQIIEDILGVETEIFEYADNYLPGSIGVANNKGCLVHPLSSDEEIEQISEILKVEETDVSTVNRGVPYLSSGAVINDNSGLFGLACTGPEMMRLTNVLNL